MHLYVYTYVRVCPSQLRRMSELILENEKQNSTTQENQ